MQHPTDKTFEDAYLLHLHNVIHFANSYLKDKDAAECVAHEVFYALWVNREKIDFKSGVLPYLLVLAKNRCLNILKKENNKRKYENYESKKFQSYTNSLALNDISSTNLYSNDVEKIYKKCVDEMPDNIKSTFLLSRSKRYSNDEIAHIQGLSVKTVEKRITFSLKLLKVVLKDYLIIIVGCFIS